MKKITFNVNYKNSPDIINFLTQQGLYCEATDAEEEINKLQKECADVMDAKYSGNSSASPTLPKETLLMADANLNCQFNSAANSLKNVLPALTIDAGGTNLRVVILSKKNSEYSRFKNTGVPSINGEIEFLYYQKCRMPGSQKPTTAKEFLAALVRYLEPALNHPSCKDVKVIQFCFSYPFTFNKQGHAIVGTLSKEMHVEGLAGTALDVTLKNAINTHYGFTRIADIIVLNDTSATLLSSLAGELHPSVQETANEIAASQHLRLGLVLGTGFNIAFVGKNPASQSKEQNKEQSKENKLSNALAIFNTEMGNYAGFKKNEIDAEIAKYSENPGKGLTEKCISGSYLGWRASIILRKACEQNLLPPANEILPKERLSTEDLAVFLALQEPTTTITSEKFHTKTLTHLSGLTNLSKKHKIVVHTLLLHLIDKAALLAAISTSAIIALGKKQLPHSTKTLLNLNGSVILKLPHFKNYFLHHINKMREIHNTEIEVKVTDRAPTIGCIFARK